MPLVDPIPLESQPIVVVDLGSEDSSHEGEAQSSGSNLSVDNSLSIWVNPSVSKEEKIWSLAKKIGGCGNDVDQAYIERIKEMEDRDKEASKKMVNLNGSE